MPSVIAHDVRHGVPGVEFLDGVSLEAPAGELTAVVGPEGAGKTSLLHVLAGLDRPRAGTVVVDGARLEGLGELELTRLRRDRIGLLLPTASLLAGVTAAENVALPLMIAGRPPSAADVAALLSRVGLGERAEASTRDLTVAERQRVALARALAGGPAVILADEPASALSPEESSSLLALLGDIAREDGVAVVLFTRDREAALEVADQVIALEAGRPCEASLAA